MELTQRTFSLFHRTQVEPIAYCAYCGVSPATDGVYCSWCVLDINAWITKEDN